MTTEELERQLAAERKERQYVRALAENRQRTIRDAEDELAKLGIPVESYSDGEQTVFTIAGGVRELGRRLAEEREARQRAEAAAAAFRSLLEEIAVGAGLREQPPYCFLCMWQPEDGPHGPWRQFTGTCPLSKIDPLLQQLDAGTDLLQDVRRVAQAAMERCWHDTECVYWEDLEHCDCSAGTALDVREYEDVVRIIRRRSWNREATGGWTDRDW